MAISKKDFTGIIGHDDLDACTKKLDALFNMRLNEEIGPEEYARKKDDLTQEKQKYESLIADTQDRIETWLKKAEEVFSFAQTAQNASKPAL